MQDIPVQSNLFWPYMFIVHVLHIASSTLYDSTTTTSEALTIMTNNYASTTAWHYTDPNNGQVPDLHHGIFYKNIGGGGFILLLFVGCAFNTWLNLIESYTLLSGLANLFSSCDSNGVCTKWGVQCNPNSGFGLSGGVQGSISDIDGIPTMFWWVERIRLSDDASLLDLKYLLPFHFSTFHQGFDSCGSRVG